jgi:PKD repeat protein
MILLMSVAAGAVFGGVSGAVNLEWDPVSDSRVSHYEVHYGIANGKYDNRLASLDTSVAVPGLEPGQTYYFAARACDQSSAICSEFSNEVSTTVASEPPTAAFTADRLIGTAPLMVGFTDQSSGSVDEWSWDFGDGGAASVQSPQHSFVVAGTYTVTLTVTGRGGTSKEVKAAYVQVLPPPPPSAQFAADVRSGVAPLTVTFADRSSGVVTACNWAFGDGGTSTTPTAVHTYSMPGFYTVSLEASGPGGSDTEVKQAYVEVKTPAPVAAFSGDNLRGSAPLTVAFRNESTGQVDRSAWEFGDGATGGQTHPTHTYTEPGVYAVTLVVSNPSGSDTLTRSGYVQVNGGEIPMEVGELSVDHEWQRVDFTKSFSDPVVVAKPISNNGGQQATVRISGIDTTGFWVRVQEWDYLDGWHAVEQLSYIVMERGHHQLPGGAWVEAGRIQSSGSSAYVAAEFTAPFAEAPVVFATVTSTNEADAVVTRSRNISTAGFEVTLQEQERNAQQHLPESVDYIAWEPSFGVVNDLRYEVGLTDAMVTDQPYSLLYKGVFDQAPLFLADMQTTLGGDTANLRWNNRTEVGLEVWVSEEQSRDSETGHIQETVGYLVVDHEG